MGGRGSSIGSLSLCWLCCWEVYRYFGVVKILFRREKKVLMSEEEWVSRKCGRMVGI